MTKDDLVSKDTALKMAINTMEIWNGENVKTNTASFRINFEGAIQACKEALEQPAQEPVAWVYQNNSGYPSLKWNDKNTFNYDSIARKQPDIPLYTHPHQWQGLTDDEIVKELERTDEYMGKSFFAGVRWAKQALKDKNSI
jgi:hypothetical protein